MLAKSDPPISLEQHTQEVTAAATRLCQIWSSIPVEVVLAARFHDFGKAASGFQAMLTGGAKWEFRHEFLSAAIFKQCFDTEEASWRRAYLAVLTHHKNLGSVDSVGRPFLEGGSRSPYSRWFKKWAELNFTGLKETFQPTLDNWQFDAATSSPANEASTIIATIVPAFEDLQLTLLRGALVAADHLASSQIGNTIQGSNITLNSLECYMQENCKEDGSKWKGWKQIQDEAAGIKDSAALIAPTGSGKTEAALLWAIKNRKGHERIFYVLPYQVSINAMAERISRAFPDTKNQTKISENENVAVLHSNTDLAYLQDALNDEIPAEKAVVIARIGKEAARKIYSPIKVTTVYQLLDIFFGRKFFEAGLLELTNSLVIFDEIHAYDGHTLGLILVLLKYLRKLNARVFIMTATLPAKLRTTLQEAAGIPQEREIRLADDDSLRQEVRRRIVLHDCRLEEMIDTIRETVRQGKKTAVVCNTVNKAIELYVQLAEFDPLLVHSRFTLGDRAERETKENIDRQNLVISTQVIEVSLDVSFEVMFTELAPVDSLLQRFGRVNRHGQPDPDNPALCHVACAEDAGSQRIYDARLLELTKAKMPSAPLDFVTACDWIERVYPDGLPKCELNRMNMACEQFTDVVAQLRPMLDPPARVDLEANLFDSVQVIPGEYEDVWRKLKEEKCHLEAKRLIVNVSKPSWCGAIAECQCNAREAYRKITVNEREYTIALFQYYGDTGLRLDRPLPSNFEDQCI